MAKDGFGWLVLVIEEEETFPEMNVWVIVPGGLLFGTLVSEKVFSDYGKDNPGKGGISMEEGMLRAEMKLYTAELLDKYETITSAEHSEACFVDTQIFSGGVALRPNRVRVRISDVSAWGFGTPPEIVARMPKVNKPAQSSG